MMQLQAIHYFIGFLAFVGAVALCAVAFLWAERAYAIWAESNKRRRMVREEREMAAAFVTHCGHPAVGIELANGRHRKPKTWESN